jgi:hypothetical protein
MFQAFELVQTCMEDLSVTCLIVVRFPFPLLLKPTRCFPLATDPDTEFDIRLALFTSCKLAVCGDLIESSLLVSMPCHSARHGRSFKCGKPLQQRDIFPRICCLGCATTCLLCIGATTSKIQAALSQWYELA